MARRDRARISTAISIAWLTILVAMVIGTGDWHLQGSALAAQDGPTAHLAAGLLHVIDVRTNMAVKTIATLDLTNSAKTR